MCIRDRLDAEAVLLVEVDGSPAEVTAQGAVVERVGREQGAREVRTARDEAERALFWKARKSAFGAVARIAPNYYLHDCVVPRTRLVEVLERIAEIAVERDLIIMNVFHAGDGNLHPLIAFDRRDAEQVERVHAAGKDIIEACVAVGGVLSGEHGIGLEKRDYMPLTFGPADLDAQARARDAFDPSGRLNPAKVLPDRVAALRRSWGVPTGMRIVLVPGRVAPWNGHMTVSYTHLTLPTILLV